MCTLCRIQETKILNYKSFLGSPYVWIVTLLHFRIAPLLIYCNCWYTMKQQRSYVKILRTVLDFLSITNGYIYNHHGNVELSHRRDFQSTISLDSVRLPVSHVQNYTFLNMKLKKNTWENVVDSFSCVFLFFIYKKGAATNVTSLWCWYML